jgi:hypothetical protein
MIIPGPASPPERPGLRSPAGRSFAVALTLTALSLLPGCGGTGEISGKVYYKDKVVTSGFVTLVSSDGVARNSEITEDGSYRIPRVPAGEAKIAVSSPPLDPSKGSRPMPKRTPPKDVKAAPPEEGPTFTENQKKTWREIPAHYSDITKSRQTFTVTSGANSHDIKLD